MKNPSVQRSILGASIAVSFLLVACSVESKPMNAGERIEARGEAISSRGEAWIAGQHDLKNGQKLVASSESRTTKGEKKLKQAQEAVTHAEHQLDVARIDRLKGEALITGGTAKMAQAEAAYSAIRSGPPAVEPR